MNNQEVNGLPENQASEPTLSYGAVGQPNFSNPVVMATFQMLDDARAVGLISKVREGVSYSDFLSVAQKNSLRPTRVGGYFRFNHQNFKSL